MGFFSDVYDNVLLGQIKKNVSMRNKTLNKKNRNNIRLKNNSARKAVNNKVIKINREETSNKDDLENSQEVLSYIQTQIGNFMEFERGKYAYNLDEYKQSLECYKKCLCVFEEKINDYEKKLKEDDSNIKEYAIKFDKIDKKIDKYDDYLKEYDSNISGYKDKLNEYSEKLTDYDNKLVDAIDKVNIQNVDIEEWKKILDEYEEKIKLCEERLDNNKSKSSEMLESYQRELEEFKAKLDEYKIVELKDSATIKNIEDEIMKIIIKNEEIMNAITNFKLEPDDEVKSCMNNILKKQADIEAKLNLFEYKINENIIKLIVENSGKAKAQYDDVSETLNVVDKKVSTLSVWLGVANVIELLGIIVMVYFMLK